MKLRTFWDFRSLLWLSVFLCLAIVTNCSEKKTLRESAVSEPVIDSLPGDAIAPSDGSVVLEPHDTSVMDSVTPPDKGSERDAVSLDEGSRDSSVPEKTSTLSAPSNLAIVVGGKSAVLHWDLVPGATSYRLYWGTSSSVTKSSQKMENVKPGVVHNSLKNGQTYYYAVAASKGTEESVLSLVVSGTPTGLWQPIQVGSGVVTDFSTGKVIRLPVERRVHVLIMSEGYLPGMYTVTHFIAASTKFTKGVALQSRAPSNRKVRYPFLSTM